MTRLDDKIAHDILVDHVDFKLIMAKKYLSLISSYVSYNYDLSHFHLEKNCESFLFFSNLAIEVITDIIIREFKIQFTDRDPSIYKIKNKLDPKDPRQKKVYHTISHFFEYPLDKSIKLTQSQSDTIRKKGEFLEWVIKVKEIEGEFFYHKYDFTNSSLWKLRELRNFIAHKPIINRQGHVGVGLSSGGNYTELLFKFNWVNKRKHHFEETISNPQQYFSNLFSCLVNFIEEIRTIIPYKHASYQYKNPPDFELEF